VRVKGTTQQARTKCSNVATRHAKVDAIEAAHDEGAMRHATHARGDAAGAARGRRQCMTKGNGGARAKAVHDEGQRVAKGHGVARGRLLRLWLW
jgi:hypothetical protein